MILNNKQVYILGMIILLFFLGCNKKSTTRQATKNMDNLIVIDAGHGGHDSGAVSHGFHEKDLVLQIAKKAAKALKKRGYKVHLTRKDDRFLRLTGRTKIADRKNATLFISIHANAIANKNDYATTQGIETYFLQKTRDARSQRIARRENNAVLQNTDTLSKSVIIDSVLNGPKIIESNKLAIDIQRNIMGNIQSMYADAKNGGVRPAPFYVLVGASRPSVLIEVGYITNPKERIRLFTKKYQEGIANGIAKGAIRYMMNRKKEMGF